MKHSLVILAALALAPPAFANGFAPLQLNDTGDVCYQWEGGHGSAGAFSRCQPNVQIAVLQPVPAPLAAPPTPAPQMMPMQSCPPLPVPHHKPIIKRKPKVQC